MANEVKWTRAAAVVLEANGSSAANAAFAAADDAALSTSNAYEYPYADVAIKVAGFAATLSTAVIPTIALYRQDLNVGSTDNDMPAPSVTFRKNFVGNFIMPLGLTSATTACDVLTEVSITADCSFSIENNAGQSLNAGWTLTAVPKTYIPGS